MSSRRVPDLAHVPAARDLPIKTFSAGAWFIRVYDHDKARDTSSRALLYRPIDFNPTLLDDKPTERGRFSARKNGPKAEHYSYLYLGEQVDDERVAILEVVDALSLGRTTDATYRLLDLPSVASLSFVYAQLQRAVTLIDISTEPNASVFLADLLVLRGNNHRLTRRWARYFRSIAPYMDGLYYAPQRYGSLEHGGNVVFFAPHYENGNMIKEDYREVPLTSREGIARLVALSRATRLMPNI